MCEGIGRWEEGEGWLSVAGGADVVGDWLVGEEGEGEVHRVVGEGTTVLSCEAVAGGGARVVVEHAREEQVGDGLAVRLWVGGGMC